MRYCLALDLKPDAALIAEYEAWHRNVWPEVVESIRQSGITDLQIYRIENRLFMIVETDLDFSWERKSEMDKNNLKVQEWERLMWRYQQGLPTARPGEKWLLMDRIFSLNAP